MQILCKPVYPFSLARFSAFLMASLVGSLVAILPRWFNAESATLYLMLPAIAVLAGILSTWSA
jgi:hypothetical protein